MTIPSGRFAALFLQSRRAGPIAVALIAVAMAAWAGLESSNDDDLTRLLRMVIPLAVAVVVGAGIESPFGEAERTASLPLPAARFGHLALLLVLGMTVIALAGDVAGEEVGLIPRNCAGFIGLALLGAWALGAATFWVVPLGYAGAVFVDFLVRPDRDAAWRWPLQPGDDITSWMIAAALLVAGVVVVGGRGIRDLVESTA